MCPLDAFEHPVWRVDFLFVQKLAGHIKNMTAVKGESEEVSISAITQINPLTDLDIISVRLVAFVQRLRMPHPSSKARISVVMPLICNDEEKGPVVKAARGSVLGRVQHMKVAYRVPRRFWPRWSTSPENQARRRRCLGHQPGFTFGNVCQNLQTTIAEDETGGARFSKSKKTTSNTTSSAEATLTNVCTKDCSPSLLSEGVLTTAHLESKLADYDPKMEDAHELSQENLSPCDNSRAIAVVLERVTGMPGTIDISLLEVLLLRGNNITDFGPLRSCSRLKYLDLSFNRIRSMPQGSFFCWGHGPAKLRTLLLDHNFLSNWETLRSSIEAAHRLSILTLAENPIANFNGYRTAIVNIAPALQLLDRHPVADEELIEGADFAGTRFSAPIRGKRAGNTHWSSRPPLSLDFAKIDRMVAHLGGERALCTHSKLVTCIAYQFAALLSPSRVIQAMFRRRRLIKTRRRKKLRFRVLAAALHLANLGGLRKRNTRRCSARLIQSRMRRHIVRSNAERGLHEILLKKGEPLSLVDYVDAKPASCSVTEFALAHGIIHFSGTNNKRRGKCARTIRRWIRKCVF